MAFIRALLRVVGEHFLTVAVGVWLVISGTSILAGGTARSSSARWEDVVHLLIQFGLPIYGWGLLPLTGGLLILAGQTLTSSPLPDIGLSRAFMFAGHLMGCSSAWVLGVSALLLTADNDTANYVSAVVYLTLALPVCLFLAYHSGAAVLTAAKRGTTHYAKW